MYLQLQEFSTETAIFFFGPRFRKTWPMLQPNKLVDDKQGEHRGNTESPGDTLNHKVTPWTTRRQWTILTSQGSSDIIRRHAETHPTKWHTKPLRCHIEPQYNQLEYYIFKTEQTKYINLNVENFNITYNPVSRTEGVSFRRSLRLFSGQTKISYQPNKLG